MANPSKPRQSAITKKPLDPVQSSRKGLFKSLFQCEEGSSSPNTPKLVIQAAISPPTNLSLPVRSRPQVADRVPSTPSLHPVTPHALQTKRGRRNYNDFRVGQRDSEEHGDIYPRWYIPYPEYLDTDHSENLCENCCHIDLQYLFCSSATQQIDHPDYYIRLGSMQDIADEKTCPLCKLVSLTVSAQLRNESGKEAMFDPRTERLLTANWYLSPFVYFPQGTSTRVPTLLASQYTRARL